jgi:hypothetical protein
MLTDKYIEVKLANQKNGNSVQLPKDSWKKRESDYFAFPLAITGGHVRLPPGGQAFFSFDMGNILKNDEISFIQSRKAEETQKRRWPTKPHRR